jgi:CheY-like chemotaxis protein
VWKKATNGLKAMVTDLFHTPAARGRPRQILVVDDDPPSREGLNTALVREGHVVDTAADAWQAIVRVRAHPFDIAVVDLDLPAVHGVDLGGWDVVQIARAYQPAIAVIVLSSDEDPTQGLEARALDVLAVLGKPISLQQLTDLVDRLPSRATSRAPRSRIGR